MSSAIRYSIIIPCYNSEGTLLECLAGLESFSPTDSEIILIDDQSDVPLSDWIDSSERLIIKRNIENRGPAYCRNRGVSIARGEIFLFIDSDVIFDAQNLEHLRLEIKKQSHYKIFTAGHHQLKPREQNFPTMYKAAYMNHMFQQLDPDDVRFLYGSFAIIHREVSMPWNPLVRWGEDTELAQRLRERGEKIRFLQTVELDHRKTYTFKGLIKNDYMIPFGFSRVFWLHFAQVIKDEGQFSHTSHRQIFCLVLTVCSVLALARIELIALFLFLNMALNLSFTVYCFKKQGLLFSLASSLWKQVDQVIMASGVMIGLAYYFPWEIFFFQKPKARYASQSPME